MRKSLILGLMALGVAAAHPTPASAVGPSPGATKPASVETLSVVDNVRWRGRHYGRHYRGAGIGLALGAIALGLASHRYYSYRSPRYGYYYDDYYYRPRYYSGYYGYSYPRYGRHHHHRHWGHRRHWR